MISASVELEATYRPPPTGPPPVPRLPSGGLGFTDATSKVGACAATIIVVVAIVRQPTSRSRTIDSLCGTRRHRSHEFIPARNRHVGDSKDVVSSISIEPHCSHPRGLRTSNIGVEAISDEPDV